LQGQTEHPIERAPIGVPVPEHDSSRPAASAALSSSPSGSFKTALRVLEYGIDLLARDSRKRFKEFLDGGAALDIFKQRFHWRAGVLEKQRIINSLRGSRAREPDSNAGPEQIDSKGPPEKLYRIFTCAPLS
jgi:hypothetical protein